MPLRICTNFQSPNLLQSIPLYKYESSQGLDVNSYKGFPYQLFLTQKHTHKKLHLDMTLLVKQPSNIPYTHDQY